MSRKTNYLDNAAMESYFHTLKTGRTHHHRYLTHHDVRESVFEYIEIFYNPQPSTSYLNYMTPLEFERINSIS